MPKFLVASINEWTEGSRNLAATSIQNLKSKIGIQTEHKSTTWIVRIYDFKFSLSDICAFVEGDIPTVEKFLLKIDENGKCRREEIEPAPPF